ncbi:MAG: hypothetical protein H5T37_07910, partial [Methanobacteriaceae archaeon]|nr:hypothetical protein [Methanobacteriaceae archaeon]
VSMGARYWETLYGFWGIYRVYANYRPGAISHDVPIWIISSYSKIGQEEGRVLYHLKSGFAGSGWESQSIYGLFNVEAVSTTYILAYAQSQGIPVYVINQENLYEILPKLKVASWIKNWIIANVNAGHQVIIPEQELTIGQWRGTGWASIDENGLGAYIITGGLYEALHGGYGTEAM